MWRDSRSSNWSMAIMLTAPIRSTFARRSGTISSGVSVRDAGVGRALRLQSAGAPAAPPGASSTSAASGVSSTALGLASRPSCSICATSAATSSSVACTVSTQEVARWPGRTPRSRAGLPAATLRRAPFRAPFRASRIRASCASNCAAQLLGRLVGGPDLVAQIVERAQVLVELPLGRGDRLAQLLTARDVPLQLVGARDRRAARARERRPRAAGPRWRARCCARRAPRAPPWLPP